MPKADIPDAALHEGRASSIRIMEKKNFSGPMDASIRSTSERISDIVEADYPAGGSSRRRAAR